MLAVLGDKLTASQAVEAAIHGHDIPHEFSPEALAQATAVPLEVRPTDIARRVDLRDTPLVTIDGEDAKDFDDAVWCEPNRDGFRLIVAIADVSHYVRPGTPLDDEAQLRATSVYFPGFVVPMLPETLSNGICSLNPKVDRLCFCCDMQVGRDGIVASAEFYEAVMHSHARLTYTDVWNAVGEGIPRDDHAAALAKIGPLLPQVQRLHQLYKLLDKGAGEARRDRVRERRGALRPRCEGRRDPGRHAPAQRRAQADRGMHDRGQRAGRAVPCSNPGSRRRTATTTSRRSPSTRTWRNSSGEFHLRLPPWAKVKPKDFRNLLERSASGPTPRCWNR